MFALLLCSLFCGSNIHALSMKYEGIVPADKSIVEGHTKVDGSLYEFLDERIRVLMATGHYERVSTIENNGELGIVAIPIRTIAQIEIAGAKSFSVRQLLDLTGLQAGDRFNRNKAVQAGEKLKAYYGEAGFYDAVIDVEFLKKKDGNIAVRFQVDEKIPCRVGLITIDTENNRLRLRLLQILKPYVDRVFSETLRLEIQKRINEYLTENRYLRSEIRNFEVKYNEAKTKIDLLYRIVDPYEYDIVPYGLGRINSIEFYKNLDLDHYERTGVDPVGSLIEKARDFYLNRGFAKVQIRTEIQDFPKTYLRRVKFIIQEGPQVRMAKLEISGRISRTPSYYSDFILETSSDLVQFGYYNRQDIDTGIKNLLTELKNQGYLKAKMLSTRTEFSTHQKDAFVEVILDEGPQTQIREVEFSGNEAFSPLVLKNLVSVKPNTPLRLTDVENSLEALKKHYNSNGYLEMRMLNTNDDLVVYNERGTQASIRFKIFEGPQVRIARIVVEGNTFTKPYVILNEINLRDGDILTPEKMEESTIRLNRFGIFSRVDIRTAEENTSLSNRTVVITVAERDPGMFRYGAGVNNARNFSVRGFTGLSYNNLWGTGRSISGRVELNYNIAIVHYLESKVTAGYYEPFLFNTRTRGRVNVSRSQFVFYFGEQSPYAGGTANPFTVIETSTRVDFLLERELWRRNKLTWTLLSTDFQRTHERNGQCVDPTKNLCNPTMTVNYIGPTFDFDYRDNPFMPTEGYYMRFDASYADPNFGSSKDIRFVRTEATATHYTRVAGPRWVWANSVRGGYEKNLQNAPGTGIPTSYAFSLGGFNSIRGFEPTLSNSERIPPDYDLQIVYPTEKLIAKDSYYYIAKTEFRFPIFGDFGGVLFYDGGLVQVTGVNFHRPYRHSVGFGLRLNTPVGPASLDIGFKINPIDATFVGASGRTVTVRETPFRVHFYIGTF